MLGYFVVRTFFLTVLLDNWNYIRGPLAPPRYYQLGMLDEPIPSKEYYPYTLPETPASKALDRPVGERPEDRALPSENVKDATVQVENSSE